MVVVTKIDKKDAILQRKLALDGFMNSNGFKIFMADLNDQQGFAKTQLDFKGFIATDGLCKLNYNLGYNAGIDAILNIIGSYRDDLAVQA